jgi:hypothetical protein
MPGRTWVVSRVAQVAPQPYMHGIMHIRRETGHVFVMEDGPGSEPRMTSSAKSFFFTSSGRGHVDCTAGKIVKCSNARWTADSLPQMRQNKDNTLIRGEKIRALSPG